MHTFLLHSFISLIYRYRNVCCCAALTGTVSRHKTSSSLEGYSFSGIEGLLTQGNLLAAFPVIVTSGLDAFVPFTVAGQFPALTGFPFHASP